MLERKTGHATARAYDLEDVASFVRAHPNITSKTLQTELNISPGTASRYLHQLEARGTLEGRGKWPRRYVWVKDYRHYPVT